MSLCTGRTEELKGDLIKDERSAVTPHTGFFPTPLSLLLKILILQVTPIILSMRQCDIYGQEPIS